MSIIKKSYSLTFEALKKHRALLLPFVIFAGFEFVSLLFLYLIPQMPLRPLFGPPIRTFWGERFLHYPLNFILLPKLTSLSRMFLSVVLGSFLTGAAVLIVADIYYKKSLKLKSNFKAAVKKYAGLFLIVFLFTGLFYVVIKVLTISLIKYFLAGHTKLLFLRPAIWLGPILIILNFVIAILIQSAFAFAIPVLLIGNEKLIRSILKSFRIFKDFFLPTIVLVGLPMLLYIPILFLQNNIPFLIDRLFPEIVLLVMLLGIIVSSLIIDPLVVIATTTLYLLKESKQ